MQSKLSQHEMDHKKMVSKHRKLESEYMNLSRSYQELVRRMNSVENELLVVKREKEDLQFEFYNALPDIKEPQLNRRNQQESGNKLSLTQMRQAIYCGPGLNSDMECSRLE